VAMELLVPKTTRFGVIVLDLLNVAADGNGNGIVDSGDYVIWRKHNGMMVGSCSVAGAAVPEPGSILLLVIGAAIVGLSKRR